MNLGLFEGWAAGGPAVLTPPPAGAPTPVPSTADGAADPFRALMDLFAVPASEPAAGDSNAIAGAESPVLAPILPWPTALNRLTVRDTRALPVAPASSTLGDSDAIAKFECPVFAFPAAPARVTAKDIATLRIAPAPEPADDDEQTVNELVAGLFACTELTPLDRAVAQPDTSATTLTIAPIPDEYADTPVPTATAVARKAPVVTQPEARAIALTIVPIGDENVETPTSDPTSFVRPASVAIQPEPSFESSQSPRIGKAVRTPEPAVAAADASAVVASALATADASLSGNRDQAESERLAAESAPFVSNARKQSPAMPVQAVGRSIDPDRNAAVPEFATPAGRAAVTMPGGAPLAPLKTTLKPPAQSFTFTAPFTHALHAIAASRMHAATPMPETQAASLPGTTAAQIVQTIQLAWSRHGGEARITLDPEQFGDLSVAMRVDRGVVVARVQADAPQVREWLHANRDTLRAGLAEHHLRLDHLEVAATEDARESESRDSRQRNGHEPPPHQRRYRRHRADQMFELDA